MAKTKEAFIISNFSDGGTNVSFEAGKIEPIEEGSFINYKAAGLVREPTAEDRKAATKAAPAA